MHGKKSELLSHYQFRRAIALAWFDPDTYDRKGSDIVTPAPNSLKRNVVRLRLMMLIHVLQDILLVQVQEPVYRKKKSQKGIRLILISVQWRVS